MEQRGEDILTRIKQQSIKSADESEEAALIYDWLSRLDKKPGYDARKYFAQSRIYYLRGEYEKAIPGLKSALELETNFALAWNNLGLVYARLSDKEKRGEKYYYYLNQAASHYQRAVEFDNRWIYPWINLAGVYVNLKNYTVAEQYYRQALLLDPGKISARYFLGLTLENQKNRCQARQEYQTILSSPNNNIDNAEREKARKRLEQLAKLTCP